MILPDLLKHKLKIVFCGTAAGDKSADIEAYYAGAGNLFYATLAKFGFTSKLLNPQEYPRLLNYKLGLTDLAKHAHGVDAKVKKNDYDIIGFEEKLLLYKPDYVCFNGKKAAMLFLKLKRTKYVKYGLQDKTIDKTKLYVATSTSANARRYWDEKTWKEIYSLISKS